MPQDIKEGRSSGQLVKQNSQKQNSAEYYDQNFEMEEQTNSNQYPQANSQLESQYNRPHTTAMAKRNNSRQRTNNKQQSMSQQVSPQNNGTQNVRGSFSPQPTASAYPLDEFTEYAMVKEGIKIADIQQRPFQEFVNECGGNVKMAQLRYEFKEAERQGLLQDIEMKKQELWRNKNYQKIAQSPQNKFYSSTLQPAQVQNMIRFSQSQAQLTLPAGALNFRPQQPSSKREVDNKIFDNILKNQTKQDIRRKMNQEKEIEFLNKQQQIQEYRQNQIKMKQEMMTYKQMQNQEKMSKLEMSQRQWKEETLNKLRQKGEIAEQRSKQMREQQVIKLEEKGQKHFIQKQQAMLIQSRQLEALQVMQMELEQKNKHFEQKQELRKAQLSSYIQIKKQKKQQVLLSVHEQKQQDEMKRMQKFNEIQEEEREREQRIAHEKEQQRLLQIKLGEEKNKKMNGQVNQVYDNIERWQGELERRELIAAEILMKQQQILAEKQMMKSEMHRLKHESAQYRQQRKENKQLLLQEEMSQKIILDQQKFAQYKQQKTSYTQLKQQQLFKAEQKRANLQTAFFHMAVWNVEDAKDVINEIIYNKNSEEQGKSQVSQTRAQSVAEKIRFKATKIRKQERVALKMGNEDYYNLDQQREIMDIQQKYANMEEL